MGGEYIKGEIGKAHRMGVGLKDCPLAIYKYGQTDYDIFLHSAVLFDAEEILRLVTVESITSVLYKN